MQRSCQGCGGVAGAAQFKSYLGVLRTALDVVLQSRNPCFHRRVVCTKGILRIGTEPSYRLRIVQARHIRRNRLGRAMNILIWLIMGGVIGWLASVIMRSQEGMLMNIVVGIVGALVGGWLISPLVGAATINQGDLSLAGLGVSLLGAIILLAIVNLFRGRGSRL